MLELLNNQQFTLPSGIDSSSTSLSLPTGHGLTSPATTGRPIVGTIWNATDYANILAASQGSAAETVLITAIATDTATVTRGFDGTSAIAHNTAGKTYYLTLVGSAASIRSSNVLDVRSYGATGDGSTDDTTAIDTAIGDLSANDTLYFSPGTYRVTAALSFLPADILITGPGKIQLDASANHLLFRVSGKDNVRIEGLSIDCGTTAGASNNPIRFTASSTGCAVRGCQINDAHTAILVDASTDCVIEGNVLTNTTVYGILFQGVASNCVVTGNTIVGGSDTTNAIYLLGDGGGDCVDNVVSSNAIRGTTGAGILLRKADRNLISGNVVRSAGGHGIHLNNESNDNSICGNVVTGSTNNGIFVDGATTASDNTTISANHVTGSGDWGIKLDTARYSVVTGNNCHDNGAAEGGIQLDDSNECAVSGNTIRSEATGIQVVNSAADNNLIAGNVVSTCTTTGVSVGAGCDNTILGENVYTGNTTNTSDSGTGTMTRKTTIHTMVEQAGDPGNPATNYVQIYCKDDGAAKTGIYAMFSTGSAVLIAKEA